MHEYNAIVRRVVDGDTIDALIDIGFSIEKISIVAGIYISVSLSALFFIRNKLNPVIL